MTCVVIHALQYARLEQGFDEPPLPAELQRDRKITLPTNSRSDSLVEINWVSARMKDSSMQNLKIFRCLLPQGRPCQAWHRLGASNKPAPYHGVSAPPFDLPRGYMPSSSCLAPGCKLSGTLVLVGGIRCSLAWLGLAWLPPASQQCPGHVGPEKTGRDPCPSPLHPTPCFASSQHN